KITVDARGEILELKTTVNTMVDQLSSFADKVSPAGSESGTEGELGGQAHVRKASGTSRAPTDNVNSMAAKHTNQVPKHVQVGTAGKLGGQAHVRGVSGTWRDLTDNVNSMAANLTNQVRNVAQATTAVAKGDLSQKITVDARGEILELKTTVNTMVDQLSSFA